MLSARENKLILEFFAHFGLTENEVKIEEIDDTLKINLLVGEGQTGHYIGRFATTLDSLQLLVSLMVNNGQTDHRHVLVDVGGYRQERQATLENMATAAGEEVLSTGVPHALPPLSATDRRLVHLLFKDHATLTTYSEGEGQDRRLVIAPKTA